jgi:hypothetical protein
MTFGLRCSGPACRPHPASLPVRVPTVESLPPASFGFPLAVAPCGLATVAVIGPDWLLSSNKTLPMLGTPRGRPPGRPASRRTRASAAVQGDRPTKPMPERLPESSRYPTFEKPFPTREIHRSRLPSEPRAQCKEALPDTLARSRLVRQGRREPEHQFDSPASVIGIRDHYYLAGGE